MVVNYLRSPVCLLPRTFILSPDRPDLLISLPLYKGRGHMVEAYFSTDYLGEAGMDHGKLRLQSWPLVAVSR